MSNSNTEAGPLVALYRLDYNTVVADGGMKLIPSSRSDQSHHFYE